MKKLLLFVAIVSCVVFVKAQDVFVEIPDHVGPIEQEWHSVKGIRAASGVPSVRVLRLRD